MPVAIRGEVLYLPITDVFDFLKIKNVPSAGFDSVSGFLIDPQATFLVDRIHQYIRYQEKVFNLKPDDLIRTGHLSVFEIGLFWRNIRLNLHIQFPQPISYISYKT